MNQEGKINCFFPMFPKIQEQHEVQNNSPSRSWIPALDAGLQCSIQYYFFGGAFAVVTLVCTSFLVFPDCFG